MNIFIIYALIISFFTPIYAMDPMTWVKTCDNHQVALNKQSAAQSALISTLTRYRKYSETKPLAIPVNKAELDFFYDKLTPSTDDINNPLKPGSYQTEKLYYTLTPDEYYNLMGIAEKLKARTFYTNLIEQVLPSDCSRLCIPDRKQIEIIYRNSIIKKNCTKTDFIKEKQRLNDSTGMTISPNGHYAFHHIGLSQLDNVKTLWNTTTCTQIATFPPYCAPSFSPDSTYIITSEATDIRIYIIADDKKHSLPVPDSLRGRPYRTDISPDSKHILISCDGYDCPNIKHHALWSFDADNIPQPVDLNSHDGQDILFSIENLNKIPSRTNLPRQSCGARFISSLYIPHKKLFTHISNYGQNLTLFDTDAHLIASHATENCAVSALAVDSTGDYLASGYSNGALIIWDLSDITKRITGIKVATPQGKITSLAFSDNQLLLSETTRYSKGYYYVYPTALWDVHGNKILNCDNAIASKISKKGNRIIMLTEKYQLTDYRIDPELEHYDNYVTLSSWNLHNKKTTKELNETLQNLTLSQALAFYVQYQQEQEEKKSIVNIKETESSL